MEIRAGQQPLGDLVDRVEPIDGPPAFAPVADEGGGVARPAHLDGGETHLDRELGPVAVPAGKLETCAHLAGAGRVEELAKMLGVVRPATGRNERLERLADELLGVVAEELGDRRAREDDPARLVDDDDRVWGRREDRAEQVARLTLSCGRHSHSP